MSSDLDIIGGAEVEIDSTTYCTNTDIEEEFGIATVNKWADITGAMDAGEIELAKDKQRLKAFDYCNAKLRGGAYTAIPIVVDERPEIISKVEAVVAGVFLARKRPIAKEDEGAASFNALIKWADAMLKDIRRGFYVVDATITRHLSQPESNYACNCNGVCSCGCYNPIGCIGCLHPHFACCNTGCACNCSRCGY